MAKRTGGFIGQDGLNAPDPATGVSGSGGDAQVDVSFTSPSDVGGAAITEYRVTDSTGAFGATGSASPVTVSGLTNGTSYTFNVWAINPFGWSSPSDASGSVSPVASIALIAQGFRFNSSYQDVYLNNIDQLTISTTGNATDFGNLTVARTEAAGLSSSTRGIFGGGLVSTFGRTDVIDYVTIASSGNATDFGNLISSAGIKSAGAVSSSVRGVFAGGTDSSSLNVIQYITIASTGNATDFGDLAAAQSNAFGAGSSTRGLLGFNSSIYYITIASTGNAVDFGDWTGGNGDFRGGCSNGTRAVFGGRRYSATPYNNMEYFTIASTGNGTDFGDLTVARYALSGTSGGNRGVFAGGRDQSANTYDTIDYIDISSTGNATDFGNLTQTCTGTAACSNAHGGLS